MNDLPDRDLAARVREGDEAAFESMFRAHYASLCSFAHSYAGSRAEAEEIVQEVFLAIWEKRERLAIGLNLRAYLFAATRNQALNRSARARLEQRWYENAAEDTDQVQGTPPESPDEVARTTEISDRLNAALTSLTPGCRRVLELRWEQQLSYTEIAAILGISTKGVENQLARARKALRALLSDLID